MSSNSSRQLRERLDHPVIDIDGHTLEYFPALASYLAEEGVDLDSPELRHLLPAQMGPPANWHALDQRERARRRVSRPPWWGSPAENTLDLATALFPHLLHERLDELGIDVSVVYPSVGLIFLHLWEEQMRRGACRALNRYNADAFAGLGDRLIPVAAIPMHTPGEAVEEMEYAVRTLGFKAVLLAGYVQRPVGAVVDEHPDLARWCTWLDMYGLDSAYDYDEVWSACRRLGVSVAFHSGSIGWGSRASVSNYMYNHLGHLAEGGHSLCKSLFMGGVTKRFPDLNFAFLEGGAAWGAALLADLVGHWEKRNRSSIGRLDPTRVDGRLLEELRNKHAGVLSARSRNFELTRPAEDPATIDEWAACGVDSVEDIVERFVPRFYFGCEADDPLSTAAFNAKVNPCGARLGAMIGSDVAHWDVPDMTEVLEEAWEMVEHGLFDESDFRDFVFTNPVKFYTGTNPDFFAGTVVADDVKRLAGS